jgi:hypothetical protein
MKDVIVKVIEDFDSFKMVLVSSDTRTGALLWVHNENESLNSLNIYLKECIHGVAFESPNEEEYVDLTKGKRYRKKLCRKEIYEMCLRSGLPGSLHDYEWRYRFAFQPWGDLQGQMEILIKRFGTSVRSTLRTRQGHLLVTTDQLTFLVTSAQRKNDVLTVKCDFSRSIVERSDYLVCISEQMEDRWRGIHRIPSETLHQRKILRSFEHPGKNYITLQVSPVQSLSLWSDSYFVDFDKGSLQFSNKVPSAISDRSHT